MIDTRGMITVAEAANRRHLSTEQVRRKLREGKLKGQRWGGQWFVEESQLEKTTPSACGGYFSKEFIESVHKLREEITKQNGGQNLDVVEMLRQSREGR